MDLNEVKKNFEETQSLIHNLKSDLEASRGQESAELNAKIDKIGLDIADKIEQHNSRLDAIESLSQSKAEVNAVDMKKRKKEFNEFARIKCEDKKEFNAMSVDSDPDGGYLVLPTYGQLEKTIHFETGVVEQLARKQTIGTQSFVLPVNYDEFSTSWNGERVTRSNTDTAQLGRIEIKTHALEAYPQVTLEVIEDASVDIESYVSTEAFDAMSRAKATAFMSGTGVGRPRGILAYDAWTTNGTFEHGKVEQVNSGSAGAFTADGLISLQNSLKEPYQANATWLTKRANFGTILKLKNGQGDYLFNRMLDENTGTPFMLLGRPVRFDDGVAVAASNSLSMVYGDIKRAYMVVNRLGMTVLRDPYTSKGYVEFYIRTRVGGGVVNFDAVKIQKLAA